MKQKFLSFLFLLLALPLSLSAQRFVNPTPKAKSMTVMSGNVVLPADMKVSYSADLPCRYAARGGTLCGGIQQGHGLPGTSCRSRRTGHVPGQNVEKFEHEAQWLLPFGRKQQRNRTGQIGRRTVLRLADGQEKFCLPTSWQA